MIYKSLTVVYRIDPGSALGDPITSKILLNSHYFITYYHLVVTVVYNSGLVRFQGTVLNNTHLYSMFSCVAQFKTIVRRVMKKLCNKLLITLLG